MQNVIILIMNIPKPGFYYHHKHDPKGEITNYAYEVIGVGMDTESREFNVIYRPLYQNTFLGKAQYCIRPYEIFIGQVEKGGKMVPRFVKIEDKEVIEELSGIRRVS